MPLAVASGKRFGESIDFERNRFIASLMVWPVPFGPT